MVGNICVINGQRGGPPGGLCGLPGRKPSAVTDAHHLHRGTLSLHRGHHRHEQGLDRGRAGPWVACRWLTRTRPGKCFGHVVGQSVAARGSTRRPVLRPAAVPVSLYTSNRQHLARWQKLARVFIALYVKDSMDDTGFT